MAKGRPIPPVGITPDSHGHAAAATRSVISHFDA